MRIPSIIAIDGPAASGKSTLAMRLAKEFNYLFFDTGVMYRAITWLALQRNLAMSDQAEITHIAETVQIDVFPASQDDGRSYDVIADDCDITWEIRRPEVDANVSVVSAYPGVRKALTVQQRRIGQRGRVVMVGRDIGTVVLPDADLKIFLVASAEERARRRYEEILARGEQAVYDEILSAVIKRDQIDSTREVAPLQAAKDAQILDSDGLNIEQVVDRAKAMVFAAQN